MEQASPIDRLPAELLQDILSRLGWRQQLAVKRVSRRWRAAVDSCLARRQELHIHIWRDVRGFTVINLLESMPSLRRLSIPRGLSSAAPLDSALVERLCTSCPHLQEVSVFSGLDETSAEPLLRRLPSLRVLELSCSGSKGGFLSRLPAALESLSLNNAQSLDPAFARQMTLCLQLRELRLDGVDLSVLQALLPACPSLKRLSVNYMFLTSGPLPQLPRCSQLRELELDGVVSCELKTVLTACPQLERLSVECLTQMSDWYPALSQCQQLLDLRVRYEMEYERSEYNYFDAEFHILDALTACSRLERLIVDGCDWVSITTQDLGFIGQGQRFGLTHLELRNTEIDNDTFCSLADLLPSLHHLELKLHPQGLTETGLARGLRRLSCLQVLELNHLDILVRPAGPVINALGELPLETLACSLDAKPEDFVFGVASVLRLCPKLTMLCLPDYQNRLDSCKSLADQLAADPPVQSEVTLVLQGPVPEDAVLMPRNVRVLSSETDWRSALPRELQKWKQW